MNTMPLLLVIPCHAGDVDRAEGLIHWIAELAGAEREGRPRSQGKPEQWHGLENHSLLIAADSALPQERVKAMLGIARDGFHSARAMIVNVGVSGWPLASNLVFKAVARQVADFYKLPFCWLEPDAVPLREIWLDDIAEAYRRSPRPFMGAVLDSEKTIEGLPNRYMSAIGVWPQDTFERLEALWRDARFTGPVKPPKLATATWQKTVRAFDMVAADYLVPRAQHTSLIQHFWGSSYDTPPLFVSARTEADPPNAVTLTLIKPETVLFHRVKDLDGFLALWRVKLEAESPEKATAGGVIELSGHLPESQPKEGNPNWKGGSEADRERRQAAKQRSREYLEEARCKRQQEQQTAQSAKAQEANVPA